MKHPLAAAIVVAAMSLLRPAPAFAQVEEVRIGVAGMTCNLCAAGLERALRKIDAVSSVTVALADQSALVKLKPGAAFDPDLFRTAVRDAGQQMRHLELRVKGFVRRQERTYRLQPGAGPSFAVADRSAAKLQSHVGRVVRVRATVSAPPRSPLELELTDVVVQ
jgi:cation transport ATPase